MKAKRSLHKEKIAEHQIKKEIRVGELNLTGKKSTNTLVQSTQNDIDEAFQDVILPKKRKLDDLYKKAAKKPKKDENYIPYSSADRHTEEG